MIYHMQASKPKLAPPLYGAVRHASCIIKHQAVKTGQHWCVPTPWFKPLYGNGSYICGYHPQGRHGRARGEATTMQHAHAKACMH